MPHSLTLEGSYRAKRKLILQELEKLEADTTDPLTNNPGVDLEKDSCNDNQKESLSSLVRFRVNLPNEIQTKNELEANPQIPKRCSKHQKSAKLSCGEHNVDAPAVMENCFSGTKILEIFHHRTPLPGPVHQGCMDLFADNMSELYRNSSWGLDLESKAKELTHRRAQFLLVTERGALNKVDNLKRRRSKRTKNSRVGGKEIVENNESNPILAFLHYRYELDESFDPDYPSPELILYIYEIQISKRVQRCGIGRRLMSIMEVIAKRHNKSQLLSANSSAHGADLSLPLITNIMLTVFTQNTTALSFYKNKLHFQVAPCSPSYTALDQVSSPSKNTRQKKQVPPDYFNSSMDDDDCSADYEILFKPVS